jgi:hypothetical protein
VSPRALLGKDEDSVRGHVEHAARRVDELDIGVGKLVPDLRCQTGSAGLVVSNDAILNRNAHGRLSVRMVSTI